MNQEPLPQIHLIRDTDLSIFAYELHIFAGDFLRECEFNMRSLATNTGADSIAIMGKNHMWLSDALFAYCSTADLHQMISTTEFIGARVFLFHTDRREGGHLYGDVLMMDLDTLRQDIKRNILYPCGVNVERKDGSAATVSLKEWTEMELYEKDALKSWGFSYAPNQVTEWQYHYSTMFRQWMDQAFRYMPQDLEERLNMQYMEAAQNPDMDSYELFNAVQEYRKQICEESKATPKRPYTPNIFKGKVFCADCGRSLHRQRAERRKGPDTYWFHCLTNSRVEKDSCKGATMQEKELISTVTAILEKELTVALGMSLPLFQLEARQKQEKDKLKIQMSAKRQEIEKTRRLIRGLYENIVQGILTNDEYFELKADYEYAIKALSGEIEVFEKSMDSLDNQLARYRAMEKDAKTLAQDHVLTAELIERLIERIEIDHERNIHVTFRFKNEFQGKAVEPCATM